MFVILAGSLKERSLGPSLRRGRHIAIMIFLEELPSFINPKHAC